MIDCKGNSPTKGALLKALKQRSIINFINVYHFYDLFSNVWFVTKVKEESLTMVLG
ncbi:hypothetical protein GCM10028809_39620 [Spirosoma gilvum]